MHDVYTKQLALTRNAQHISGVDLSGEGCQFVDTDVWSMQTGHILKWRLWC